MRLRNFVLAAAAILGCWGEPALAQPTVSPFVFTARGVGGDPASPPGTQEARMNLVALRNGVGAETINGASPSIQSFVGLDAAGVPLPTTEGGLSLTQGVAARSSVTGLAGDGFTLDFTLPADFSTSPQFDMLVSLTDGTAADTIVDDLGLFGASPVQQTVLDELTLPTTGTYTLGFEVLSAAMPGNLPNSLTLLVTPTPEIDASGAALPLACLLLTIGVALDQRVRARPVRPPTFI